MQTWQDLLSTALVGTERQAPSLTQLDNALSEMLNQLDATDREHAVLSATGVIALWQQAGYQANSDSQPLPSPCEADTLPCCSTAAGQHLALMLQGQYTTVLPEWLAAVAAANQCLTAEYLPQILELGHARMGLRSAILPVLGERGRWLAQQNPQWRYAVAADDETAWETGSRDERLALLTRWRETAPEQARALLETTWRQEAAKDRSAFLETLQANLSMADEPFLENALADRSKDVRRVAAKLLTQLPESRLVQRVRERVTPLLSFIPRRLGRHRIEASLPDAADSAMLRDIFAPKPREIGEKAWLLTQLIAAVPPSLWNQQWNQTPQEILKASKSSEWQDALLQGWSSAAIHHQDAGWADALLAAFPSAKVPTQQLLSVLPPERQEYYLLNMLQRDLLADDNPVLEILQQSPQPWSSELSHAVLNGVRQQITRRKPADGRLRPALLKFAHRFPPRLSEVAAKNWPTSAPHWSRWENTVHEFLALLQFRRDMHAAINAS